MVVGGGAAGFFAAIECGRGAEKGTVVTVLESGKKVLEKVRISGGGRCNTTHAAFDREVLSLGYPRGMKELLGPFTVFDAKDTVQWFSNHGVELKTEKDGRMFPVTDNSETIIDALVEAAKDAGVIIRTSVRVTDITKGEGDRGGFRVHYRTNGKERWESCDKVLIASGSSKMAYAWAEKLGHRLVEPMPSLFTFNVKDTNLRELAGVSVPHAVVRLVSPLPKRRTKEDGLEQTGPILFTHWGLSGPAILRLSAFSARLLFDSNYQAEIEIDWHPTCPKAETRMRLEGFQKLRGGRTIGTSSSIPSLPTRLWRYLLIQAGIDFNKPWGELKKGEVTRLMNNIHSAKYTVEGKGVFKEEFVTSGGVNLRDVNLRTMESKVVPGLFFAGEVCNYDGITGGFNLQGAWTTGFIAGRALSQSS